MKVAKSNWRHFILRIKGHQIKQSTISRKEVSAMLCMTQIIDSGAQVDIVNFIGKYECSKTPHSLFDSSGSMRAAGRKASFVKTCKKKQKLTVLIAFQSHN